MLDTQNLGAYRQNVNGGSVLIVEMSVPQCWVIYIQRPPPEISSSWVLKFFYENKPIHVQQYKHDKNLWNMFRVNN